MRLHIDKSNHYSKKTLKISFLKSNQNNDNNFNCRHTMFQALSFLHTLSHLLYYFYEDGPNTSSFSGKKGESVILTKLPNVT